MLCYGIKTRKIMNTKLTSSAVLVNLHIGLPGNFRKDVAVTQKVLLSEQMGTEAGKWSKQLYPKSALRGLQSWATNVRQWHYSRTLVYPDDSWAILPASLHLDYTQAMAASKADFALLRADFEANFQTYVAWAQAQQNGNFDASCYDQAETMQKFAFGVSFRPVPASTQYEATLASLLGADATSVDTYVAEAAQAAQRDLWQRVLDILKEVQGLRGRERKPKEDFIKGLFERLKELESLVPKLNLDNDSRLDDLAAETSAAFATDNAMVVRDSGVERESAAQKADALVRKLQGYNIL